MAGSATARDDLRAISLSDLNTTVNHEPRILDTRLAEALGFDRPRDIRKLIDRHRKALERFGGICSTVEQTEFPNDFRVRATVAQTSAKGGRPGRSYYLNRKQAIYLCTKSETDRATDITIEIVEVYDAVTTRAAPTEAVEAATAPKRRQRRPAVPGPISRYRLETYASWLHWERVAVNIELYGKEQAARGVGVIMSNPGSSFHARRNDRIVPPPSARADAVLKLVGCG